MGAARLRRWCAGDRARRRVEGEARRQGGRQAVDQFTVAGSRPRQHEVDHRGAHPIALIRHAGAAEGRHCVRFHRDGEPQRGGVAVFVGGRPGVRRAPRRRAWRSGDRAPANIERKPARQRRRQAVGERPVAADGLRQAQGNGGADAVGLIRHLRAERRHRVRFHRDGESQRGLVAVFVGRDPCERHARRYRRRGSRNGAARGVKRQSRRQRRRQLVGDVAVAAGRRRQLQRRDRAAHAVGLVRHVLAEGRHGVFEHFDGERQRLFVIVVVEGRQRVARAGLRAGGRAAHDRAQRIERQAVGKRRRHRVGRRGERQRQGRLDRTADAVHKRRAGADAEVRNEVRHVPRRRRRLRRRPGPGGVHGAELKRVQHAAGEAAHRRRGGWRVMPRPRPESAAADGIAQLVVRDVRRRAPPQDHLASAGNGNEVGWRRRHPLRGRWQRKRQEAEAQRLSCQAAQRLPYASPRSLSAPLSILSHVLCASSHFLCASSHVPCASLHVLCAATVCHRTSLVRKRCVQSNPLTANGKRPCELPRRRDEEDAQRPGIGSGR